MRNGTDYNIIARVPEGAHVCGDNRVYVVQEKRYFADLKYNKDVRVWLGKAISKTEMHPNAEYKRLYPELLAEIPHLHLPVYEKRLGVYAVTRAIAGRNGLYEDLVTCLGPQSANLLMDYAVYSIITKSNAAKDFDTEMEDCMTFLGRPYSDSWIHDYIRDVIQDNQIQAFKNGWVKRFGEETLMNVWLCIDGSNNDSAAKVEEAEKGKAKSRKNANIISFLYAVTQDGMPVTSQIYRGGRVDCKAIEEMIAILEAQGIKPKGVILDRGFCDESCMQYLKDHKYEFVIMMKENTYGFHQLSDKYRNEIRLQWKYALGNGLYGATDKVRIFKKGKLYLHAALIWDSKNGIERANYLIDEVKDSIFQYEQAVKEGKSYTIPDKYKKYLSVDKQQNLIANEQILQTELSDKGFYGLVFSENLAAKEANETYDLRDCSEKQYSIMKSQIGFDTFRVHDMHGIRVRELIAFVASIIRHEIQFVCRNCKSLRDTNKGIKELNLIRMNMIADNKYQVLRNQTARQKELLKLFQLSVDDLDSFADLENKRLRGERVSPIQGLPVKSATEEDKPQTVRIDGIPAGSKAKGKGSRSSHLKSVSSGEDGLTFSEESVKRGPGRPKGSKNKPKLVSTDPVIKRKPGRPKGSKNKPKTNK